MKSSSTSKNVYIYQANRKDEPVCKFMYEPWIKTLSAGFTASTGSTWNVVVPTPTVEYKSALESGIAALGSGDIFIFVGGVGKGTFLDAMYAHKNTTSMMRETESSSTSAAANFREHAKHYNFEKLRSNGVLIVYVQTEAGWECALTSADPVDELWDYSYYNIKVCEEAKNSPTVRYVPPGYMADAPLTPTSGPVGSLFHLGHAWWRTCWLELYNHIPGELAFESAAWKTEAWTGILKHHNLFLNLHKGECRWEMNPFAAARASRIISSGGILISEKGTEEDMNAYSGIVDFVDFDQIPTKYAQFQAQTPVIYDAQRQMRLNQFQTRFSPSTIFTNAGIYTMLDARR